MNSNIIVNNIFKIDNSERAIIKNAILAFVGVAFLALMAQVRITLPFTPVPITGQTFAVMLIGLTYGRKLGLVTISSYIFAGTLGLPVFSGLKSGFLLLSPTGGYIIGFFFAIAICGYFAELGWTKSYTKLFVTLAIAYFVLYAFGLLQLKLFFPNKNVLAIGLIPFIPGMIIKTIMTVILLPTAWKIVK